MESNTLGWRLRRMKRRELAMESRSSARVTLLLLLLLLQRRCGGTGGSRDPKRALRPNHRQLYQSSSWE
jgi:hypothetical protein